jgi:hypothetical protein
VAATQVKGGCQSIQGEWQQQISNDFAPLLLSIKFACCSLGIVVIGVTQLESASLKRSYLPPQKRSAPTLMTRSPCLHQGENWMDFIFLHLMVLSTT